MALPPKRLNVAANMPAELMVLIFLTLPQPALLAAAAVCAWWRANATQAPLFYRPVTFIFPQGARRELLPGIEYDDIDAFELAVADSEARGYRLGLSVYIEAESLASSNDGLMMAPEAQEAAEAELQTIVLPLLRRAVARCVILNIFPDLPVGPALLNGLYEPAPYLRILTIDTRGQSFSAAAPAPDLPPNFLAATAPRLEEVVLLEANVFSFASPSFPTVRKLWLSFPDDAPPLDTVVARFPNMQHLVVEALPFYMHRFRPAETLIFKGLQVLQLGPDDVSSGGSLDAIVHEAMQIPDISYSSKYLEAFEPFLELPKGKASASLTLFEHPRDDEDDEDDEYDARFTQLSFELRSGDRVRRVRSDVPFDEVFYLILTGDCTLHMTKLTIDDRHLRRFMQTCGECMPRLASLRVVLVTRLWADHALSRAEEVLYVEPHARNECSCIRGIFGDSVDGAPPCGDIWIEWTFLERLELRATRPDSTISKSVLSSLVRTFGRNLQLTLSNGLALAPDARGADVAAMFSAIIHADSRFYAELDYVARVNNLIDYAAAERIDARARMDDALLRYGPDYHYPHCEKAPSPSGLGCASTSSPPP